MTTQQKQNCDYAERFEQAGCISVEKMFWIAGSLESGDLKDMLKDDMSIKDWQRMMPEIDVELLGEYLDSDMPTSILIDYHKRGFIAETRYPSHYDFQYKKGKVIGCSISGGISTIGYVYGETIDELMINIEKEAAENYKYCIEQDKKKKAVAK